MRPNGSPDELERRRLRALDLLEAGHGPAEVARRVGVTRSAVSQWKKRYQSKGREALKAIRHPGPTPKLTAVQCRRLLRQNVARVAYDAYTRRVKITLNEGNHA